MILPLGRREVDLRVEWSDPAAEPDTGCAETLKHVAFRRDLADGRRESSVLLKICDHDRLPSPRRRATVGSVGMVTSATRGVVMVAEE